MEGQKPFGYRSGEQSIVGQIKALRSDGHSYEAIANILNAEARPTRKVGGQWFATSVKRVLTYTVSTETDKLTHSDTLAA
jgi:hypothetical protein